MMTELPTQSEFRTAINKITASKSAYTDLREVLDQIGKSHQGDKVFSTIINSANDGFLNEIRKLQCISDGAERINNSNFVFITKDETPCVCKLELPKGPACYVFHVQMQIRCAVHDGAFIEIGDGADNFTDRIIIGNTNISLSRNHKSFAISGEMPLFFTVVVTENKFRLYLNGELLVNSRREETYELSELRVGLRGKSGSTLEASLLNMEVWTSEKNLRELTYNEEQNFLEKVKSLVDDGELEKAIRLLQGNSVDLGEDLEIAILALVHDEISIGDKGFRDWLFEKLRSSLSETAAKRLDEICDEGRQEPDIVVQGVTVEFLDNPAEQYSLSRIMTRRKNKTFDVLRDVSFTVYPGDRVGVIGQNGAGKSTLLRTITGLIPIESGEILMRGEYMLLKAGIGMRNELTGRENIYHAGAYLGLWGTELDRICEEVIAFSELEAAIDRPFKFYSDGMKARLVFSLATSVKPDILLLDELLSAGDINFKKKAEQRLEDFLNSVRVLIVVSHGISFVRDKCNKALFISKCGPCFFGDPEEAISRYLNEFGSSPEHANTADQLLDADSTVQLGNF